MVAYSLKARFVVPVLVGLGVVFPGDGPMTANGFEISTFGRTNLPRPKRQTIRAKGKRRHARPGETLQLYTAMRTKQCRLIGLARCVSVHRVQMTIGAHTLHVAIDGVSIKGGHIHRFASDDGFGSAEEMLAFWHEEHKGVKNFDGFLIMWEPITKESTNEPLHSVGGSTRERRSSPGPEQRKARRRAARRSLDNVSR